jgi:hypothetical protein
MARPPPTPEPPNDRTSDPCNLVRSITALAAAAGWFVGESCFMTDAGVVWQKDGTNGEKRLFARAPTQAGAWRAACSQAVAIEARL